MIDLHSHIIYGVDDGPETLEESLDLLGYAYEQGVRVIISTSHRRKGMFETPEEVIEANFATLRQEALKRYPDLLLGFGGELYYTKELVKKLENKEVPTLNYTRFVLLEFSKTTPWRDIQDGVNEILLLGLTPLIAHIERYDALAFKAERVEELINRGCYTQINSSHVLKPKLFGDATKEFKKRARYFLEEDLVHCIASDMHNLTERPPYMKEAYQLIAKDYGEEFAKDLFERNPKTLLQNQYI